MARVVPLRPVQLAFEGTGIRVAIADLVPLRIVAPKMKRSSKYLQIAASVREVGLVEPPVIARDRNERGQYLLLDGHLRIEVLKDMGESEVGCIISTDDEGFTYNRRVNRLAMVQEHKMIMKAIEDGASPERIAKTLNVNIATIDQKRRLLDGICQEAVNFLKDKHVPINTFWVLKKMKPIRQIEAAHLMVTMNKYTVSYAQRLLAATPQNQLVDSGRPKRIKGLSNEQLALMERESANLEREFKLIEQSYGPDHLDLVLARGYLASLLNNIRVSRYLGQNYPDIFRELRRIAEMDATAA